MARSVKGAVRATRRADLLSHVHSRCRTLMDPIFLFSSSGHPPDASLNDAGPSSTQSHTCSASELLTRSRTLDTFSSGSHAIDDIFNDPQSVAYRQVKGGLPRGTVLDLSGPPGSGKSRMGLDWVVGARLRSGHGLGEGKGKGKADGNGESHESHGPEVDDTVEALVVGESLSRCILQTGQHAETNRILQIPKAHFPRT